LPHRLPQVAMQWPARRSQGCEVARVLNLLDTTHRFQFPLVRRYVNELEMHAGNPFFLNSSQQL
jgi:hypothetical protein